MFLMLTDVTASCVFLSHNNSLLFSCCLWTPTSVHRGHSHSPWSLHLSPVVLRPCYFYILNSITSQIRNLRILLCDRPPPTLILYSQFFSTAIIRTFILLNTLSSSFSWPSLESVVLYPNPFVLSQNQHSAYCVLKQVHSGCFPPAVTSTQHCLQL